MLLPTNCMSVFDHSVGLALKGLTAGKIFHRLQVRMFHRK